MNLEAINKWLDEEYGCSYTRLEELHDFYFKKYCDLKKENQRLKDNWNYIKKMLKEARNEEFNIIGYCGTCTDVDIDFLLNKMQELERSDNNGIMD